MQALDFTILNFIYDNCRCAFLDVIMPVITALGSGGAIWLLLTVVLLAVKKYRKLGIAMAAALAVDVLLCNIIIKPLAARIRPCDINTSALLLVPRPEDYSFPSGHTAASFAAASALFFSRSKLWIYAAVLAAVIAFSRLYLYVHFPSDVLAGVLLGIICGYIGYLICLAALKAYRRRRGNMQE